VPCELGVVPSSDARGAGLLLYHAYLLAGGHFERGINRLAHGLGLGPDAVASRIEKAFGADALVRQLALDNLYESLHEQSRKFDDLERLLEKEAREMMKYALP
jgi:hypothetical protein